MTLVSGGSITPDATQSIKRTAALTLVDNDRYFVRHTRTGGTAVMVGATITVKTLTDIEGSVQGPTGPTGATGPTGLHEEHSDVKYLYDRARIELVGASDAMIRATIYDVMLEFFNSDDDCFFSFILFPFDEELFFECLRVCCISTRR